MQEQVVNFALKHRQVLEAVEIYWLFGLSRASKTTLAPPTNLIIRTSKLANPNILNETVLRKDEILSQRFVCSKCHATPIETSFCIFCTTHGCLCHAH